MKKNNVVTQEVIDKLNNDYFALFNECNKRIDTHIDCVRSVLKENEFELVAMSEEELCAVYQDNNGTMVNCWMWTSNVKPFDNWIDWHTA